MRFILDNNVNCQHLMEFCMPLYFGCVSNMRFINELNLNNIVNSKNVISSKIYMVNSLNIV